MKYFLMLLFAVCTNASALDYYLGEYTYHFHDQVRKGREAFTSEHPLIGIGTEEYTFIAMENSYNKFSLVLLRTYQYDMGSYLRGGLSAGIATGYEDSPTKIKQDGVIPVAYASLDIHPRHDKYGLTITYAPDEFLGAGLRFKF